MKKQKKKNDNEIAMFLKTFLIAFLLVLLISTPVMASVSKMFNINPGGDDVIALADEVSIEDWVSPDSPFFEAFTTAKRVNVLLLGVNTGLTDTIMLVSFDMKYQHVDIISVPRDTYYYRPGYTGDAEMKINAAFHKDPINTAKAVSEILMGIPINYYVVVDYEDIEKIVETMGGVPMNIPKALKYRDPYDKPPLVIDIPAGEQVLDGKHAVQFLRYRHGYAEGDLGRVKAQQEFMKSAFRQCIGMDLPKIVNVAFETIESDLTLKKALPIAAKAVGMSGDDITTYMMPGYPEPHAPYYVRPDTEKIAEMLTEIYSYGTQPETTEGAITSGAAAEEE